MRKLSWAVGGLLALAAPVAAAAQVSLEVRAGGAIGNHAPAAAGLETVPGPSFAALALYRPIQRVAVYATWSRSTFGCEEGFCVDRDVEVTSGGWGGGVRVYPVGRLWLQAGVARLSATVDSDGSETGEPAATSLDAALGADVPLFGPVSLVPALTYRAGIDADRRTTVVTAEVGLRITSPSAGRGGAQRR